MAVQLIAEEAVKIQRIISIIVVHHCHGIPFHPMLFQQVDTTHHLHKRWLSHLILPILVMKFLRTINRDAYQKIVLAKELTPFICQQCTVGLNAIINRTASGIFLLKFHRLFIKRQGAHQGFTSMPSEQHLRHGLRFNIFFYEFLQQFVTHHMARLFFI